MAGQQSTRTQPSDVLASLGATDQHVRQALTRDITDMARSIDGIRATVLQDLFLISELLALPPETIGALGVQDAREPMLRALTKVNMLGDISEELTSMANYGPCVTTIHRLAERDGKVSA